MPAMLNNRRSRQKKNKRLDAMNDGVPITTSFSQATSNKKNITCLKCGKKGHYANECLNTATVVAAAQVVEDDDSNDEDNQHKPEEIQHPPPTEYAWHGPTK
jgi:Zinc knuckle